jgi:hypothetical protein
MIQQLSPHPTSSYAEVSESTRRNSASVDPLQIVELVHELRQPLSTIECLAYYLEITSSDDSVCQQMQRIQRLIWQANRILEASYSESAAAHT